MHKIINETKLDFDDVLIRPKRSFLTSRVDVNIHRNFTFLHSKRALNCIPIMVANMDTTGTFDMAKTVSGQFDMITCLHKHYSEDQLVEFYCNNLSFADRVFYSTGILTRDIEKLSSVFNKLQKECQYIPNVCLDVANGYTEQFVKTSLHIRKLFPEIIIMAGNVVTPEIVEELIIHGKADIVKVGIGSGSVCTTRLKTGVGYPQLSAVIECSDAAHGLGGHICSDGGCKVVGDVCKAFGGNSDFVMLGSMFAGADECEGEWKYEYKMRSGGWQPFDPGDSKVEKRKVSFRYYGMSSKDAMNKHHNGVAKYRTAEGKSVTIKYKACL
jgi:GMP reductase